MPHFFHSTELRIFSFTCHAHEKEARSFLQFYEEEKWFIYWKFASWKFLLHWRGTESGLTWVIFFIPFFLLQDQVSDVDVLEGFWWAHGWNLHRVYLKMSRIYVHELSSQTDATLQTNQKASHIANQKIVIQEFIKLT